MRHGDEATHREYSYWSVHTGRQSAIDHCTRLLGEPLNAFANLKDLRPGESDDTVTGTNVGVISPEATVQGDQRGQPAVVVYLGRWGGGGGGGEVCCIVYVTACLVNTCSPPPPLLCCWLSASPSPQQSPARTREAHGMEDLQRARYYTMAAGICIGLFTPMEPQILRGGGGGG